jgi:hypothetical protein
MLSKELLDQTEAMLKRTGLIRDGGGPSDAFRLATLARQALKQYRENPSVNAELLNDRLSQVATHNPSLYDFYNDVLQPALLAEMAAAVKPGTFAAAVRQSQVATLNEEMFERLERILQAGGEQMQPVLNALRTFDVYAHLYNAREYKPDEKGSIEEAIAAARAVLLDELPKIADSHKTVRGNVAIIRSAITDIRPREIPRNG